MKDGSPALVQPQEARLALETALSIDEASECVGEIARQMRYAAYA